MSKRTIIIFAVAILAIFAGIASMYFEYKKTIDDANDVIAGTEPEPKAKPEPKPKAKPEPVVNQTTESNGTGKE